MSQCELNLDENLAEAFTRVLARRLRQDGFEQVLEYSSPDGPDIAEFQKGQSVVAIDVRVLGGGRQMVGVHSEEYDCVNLARQAALDNAAEVAAMLLAPLASITYDELRRRAREALSQLLVEGP